MSHDARIEAALAVYLRGGPHEHPRAMMTAAFAAADLVDPLRETISLPHEHRWKMDGSCVMCAAHVVISEDGAVLGPDPDATVDSLWQSCLDLAGDEVELGEAIAVALNELEEGDYATAGRDFGRGVAYATKRIRTGMHAVYEARESE